MDAFSTSRTPQVLRRRAVETMTGLARSTIYERMASGGFPRPIHLGPRSVGWLANEIEDWIVARVAESRAAGQTETKP
jgi:prophage regulatory protein